MFSCMIDLIFNMLLLNLFRDLSKNKIVALASGLFYGLKKLQLL